MSTLQLWAVDPPDARIREDGFLLEDTLEEHNGVSHRLTIATILPPSPPYTFSKYTVQKNVYRIPGQSGYFHLFSHATASECSLSHSEARPVICAVYEMRKDGYFTEVLQLTEAKASLITYEDFRHSKDFSETRITLERFIQQFTHIDYRYRHFDVYTQHWRSEVNEQQVLIAILLDLLNNTLSTYCRKMKIPTLKKQKGRPCFKVHEQSLFNAPLRRVEGLVNLCNLQAHLTGTAIPFTEHSLRSIGLDVQTT